MKEEKDIAPMDFAENQVFQRTAKFIEMKGVVMLVKVDGMSNVLKSVLATV